ncbi:hypothetical protein J6590_053076 [Homalodisca vitripennis]|nr:hypothetical protein J6590_053076 [Homalodisca vitripennis]
MIKKELPLLVYLRGSNSKVAVPHLTSHHAFAFVTAARTRSAASPTPPASDSPPACSTPGPDPALSATPSRSSTSISSPAGETTAFHASTGEKPTPVAATKPDLLATTNSLEVPTPVASSGASDADELASKKLQIKGADKAAQCRSDEGCRSFH